MAFEIARAGWVHRETTFLHRWKKSWLVLYQSGVIRHFEKPDNPVAEGVQDVSDTAVSIRTGSQISDINPPSGSSRSCLFSIEFKDTSWHLCAETPDDMSAWHIALEQARVNQASAPAYNANGNPYSNNSTVQHNYQFQQIPNSTTIIHAQPGMVHANPASPVYYQNQYGDYVAPGQSVVYVDGRRPYRRRRYDGSDVALGAMGGLAIGSLMWGPLLWW